MALIACIGCGAGLRILAKVEEPGFSRDGGIALLAATCHQEAYLQATRPSGLVGRWVDAAQWKRLVTIEHRFCFAEMSRELARYDVHPPLYFWLLHLWMLAFGLQGWTGISLNLLFFAVSCVWLYRISARLFEHRGHAVGVIACYAASSAALRVGVETRPYELLAAVSLWFLDSLLVASDPKREPSWWNWIGLGLATAAGVLTHYLFPVFVAAALPLAIVRSVRRVPLRLVQGVFALAAGTLLANLLHPLERVARGDIRFRVHSPIETADPERVQQALEVIRAFFQPVLPPYPPGQHVILGAVAAAAAWTFMARRRNSPHGHRKLWGTLRGAGIVTVPLIAFALTSGAFAWGLLPPHAMREKYLAFVWPLLAVVPIASLRLLSPALPRGVLMAAVAGMVFAHSWSVLLHPSKPMAQLHIVYLPSDRVTFDAHKRVFLARYLPRLRDGSRVFVADANVIRKRLAAWSDELDGTLWVAYRKKLNRTHGDRLRKRLREDGYRVSRVSGVGRSAYLIRDGRKEE